jgi:NADPH:quinone reductase-like Zn-dependent oxidoreductase/short-subunit dehydrogenase/acyl carrier protein
VVTPGDVYQQIADCEFRIRPAEKEDTRRLLDAASERVGVPDSVVFLWSLDQPGEDEPSLSDIDEAQRRGCQTALILLQTLAELNHFPQVHLVTCGTQPVGRENCMSVAQSPLWGFGRVIMIEQPHFHCRLIDLSVPNCREELQALFEELCSNTHEEEIALRGSARYVLRMGRSTAASRGIVCSARSSPFRLEITKPGLLDDLTLRPIERREPGHGEVEIETFAAGLNFIDVMKALGTYPRELEDYLKFGNECVGRIVAVGDGVTDFRIGDRVFAVVTAHGLASHVTCTAGLVTHVPENLSTEAAATIPAAFLTAAYALRHLAKIRDGERVLIHSGAGGVGLAAVQMALWAGCEVFATAGNENKRELLRTLGVHHVMDSRSLSFAEKVARVTGGEGVDVVLNSLAGEALIRSVSLLRRNGRFIEIGKRDIYGNTKLGLRPFGTNICFYSLDLLSVIRREVSLVQSLLGQVMSDLKQGRLHPLPRRLFPMTNVSEALRHMMPGTHVGKIVVTMSGRELPLEHIPGPGRMRFDPDATYLITGGLGGFALLTARWMVDNGARHLVLMGRSGLSSEAARQTVEELRQLSASVTVAQADITEETDLAAILEDIRLSKFPLRGVIHAAMVVDDGVMLQLDAPRLEKVMAPKIRGAWNLHRQTRGEQLDFFVLFSSISSMIGTPGQASYAGANTFLDSLAHYRREQGLPALTVNWGPIRDAGYVARHKDVRDSLVRLGFQPLKARPALTMLGRLMQTRCRQMAIIEVKWDQVAKVLGMMRPQPRFTDLVSKTSEDSPPADQGKVNREMILSAGDAERRGLVESFVREQASKVLRTSAASLEMSKPLNQLGLDSLMAVELMNRIEGELGQSVPTAKLMGGQNLRALATTLLDILEGSSPGPIQRSETVDGSRAVETLSDAEVDALLQEHAEKAEEILARTQNQDLNRQPIATQARPQRRR